MKVTEHLERATRPLISFEIIPPSRGSQLKDLLALVDDLVKFEPPFIDITSHSSEMVYASTSSGLERRYVRKRPGTMGVCALIQNKYQVDAVPHLLCKGFSRERTEDLLIELRYLGIDNVLALQGDDHGYQKPMAPGRTANEYAVELIRQIDDMNRGTYLEEIDGAQPSDFCIGAACYPEKHFGAPNLETEVRRAKEKIEAGADYLVTQMFFHNDHYFRFVERCRAAGITAPIIPGLKVLTTKKHLASIPSIFHCEIPNDLAVGIEEAKPEHVIEVGAEWAAKQVEDLLSRGVPTVHFYVMASARPVKEVFKRLKL
jgi:methylenetetrahydrofolate reductase (NADPH)